MENNVKQKWTRKAIKSCKRSHEALSDELSTSFTQREGISITSYPTAISWMKDKIHAWAWWRQRQAWRRRKVSRIHGRNSFAAPRAVNAAAYKCTTDTSLPRAWRVFLLHCVRKNASSGQIRKFRWLYGHTRWIITLRIYSAVSHHKQFCFLSSNFTFFPRD